MGDRWYNTSVNGGELSDSRYVWIPIEFGSDNRIAIRDYSDWTLDELGAKENLLIAGTLYGTSVIWGILIELMGIVL